MPKKVKDIRWLAGLLEGEGSFCWARHPSYVTKNNVKGQYATVQVCSTDRDIIADAARLMGTNVMGPYSYPQRRKATYKPVYVTNRRGKKALVLAARLYPYMGKRRKEQIQALSKEGAK